MLHLSCLIHERRKDVAFVVTAIDSHHTSWLDIHLPSVTDTIVVSKTIAGDGVAQETTELLFGAKDQCARYGMNTVGTNEEIKRFRGAVIEGHIDLIRPLLYGCKRTAKAHFDSTFKCFIQYFLQRRVHEPHVLPIRESVYHRNVQLRDQLARLVHIGRIVIRDLLRP